MKKILYCVIIMNSKIKTSGRNRGETISHQEGVESINDFSDLDEFIHYILDDCSNCLSEVLISDIKDSVLYKYKKKDENTNLCNLINTNICNIANSKIKGVHKKKVTMLKSAIVLKIIGLFVLKNMLSKKNNRFYLLNSNKKLSWHNIKNLKSNDIKNFPDDIKKEILKIFGDKYDILYYIKALFWFFRKAVVDSIISDLINYRKSRSNDEIVAMSVGSTSLTSDYDISIDASYNSSGYIIDKYGIFIEKMFNDNSESLFDTNIYGVSFIKSNVQKQNQPIMESFDVDYMISKTFNKTHQCKDDLKKFLYIQDTNIDTPQIIWAYIKTLLKLNKILNQDDKLYEILYEKLEKAMNKNNYFKSAEIFINKYESNIDNYKYIVNRVDEYLDNNKKIVDEAYLISNFISFANYNGSETYLTNGAFLDIVVNQQICKFGNTIKLSKISYFTSFIENISELMVHYHRNKYRDRCANALSKIGEYTGTNATVENINKLLNKIKDVQSDCVKDILNCNSFKIMDMCIDCIIEISKLNDDGDINKTYLFDNIIFPVADKENELEKIVTPIKI